MLGEPYMPSQLKIFVGIACSVLMLTGSSSDGVMLPGNESRPGPINHLSTTVENRQDQIFSLLEHLRFPQPMSFIPAELMDLYKLLPERRARFLIDSMFYSLLSQAPHASWPNLWGIYFGNAPSDFVRTINWSNLRADLPNMAPTSVSRLNFEGKKIVLEELNGLNRESIAQDIFRLRSAYKAIIYYQWLEKNDAGPVREVYYSLDLLGEVGFAIYIANVAEMIHFLKGDFQLAEGDGQGAASFAVNYIVSLIENSGEEFLEDRLNEVPLSKLNRREELVNRILGRMGAEATFSPRLVCEDALSRSH